MTRADVAASLLGGLLGGAVTAWWVLLHAPTPDRKRTTS